MASYRDKLPTSGSQAIISIQRAVVSASGITTDIPISAVDPSRTYLRHSVSFTSTVTPKDGCYNIELINPTTVRITRATSASNTVFPTVSVEVVSDSSCSVQRGTAASKGVVAISSINTQKSTASVHGVLSTSISAGGYPELESSISLQSSTSILISSSASSGSNYKWEVVSYV